jgi:hypothetical protein
LAADDMPRLAELTNALYGAVRLARFKADGLGYFDATVDGFWRSFFAAVLVAPMYAWLLAHRYGAAAPDDPLRFQLIEAVAYVLSWVAYPLLMVTVTRLLGRWDRFLVYAVAYNWSLVIQHAVFLPVAAIGTFGLLPADAAQVVALAGFGYILAYIWFIASSALAVTPLTAAGIVVIDIVLSLIISEVARALY